MRPIGASLAGLLALASLLAGLVIVPGSGPAPADRPDGSSRSPDSALSRQVLQETIATGHHPRLRWPDFPDLVATLDTLYGGHGWSPLWTRDGVPTGAATALIRFLRDASDLGLSPADYDAQWLEASAERLAAGPGVSIGAEGGETDPALFDLALSIAAARIGSALHHGRIDPRLLHASLPVNGRSLDLVGLLDTLRQTEAPGPILEGLEPSFPEYRLLKTALHRYRALAQDSTLSPLPWSPAEVRPGQPYHGAALRRLLTTLGDLPDTLAVAGASDTVYDPVLAAGVRRFQRRNGLSGDGIIGLQTFERLNQPLTDRVRQIELTLERLRWVPAPRKAPFIIVNIPAFRLLAFGSDEEGRDSLLRMDVVVGQAYENQTPLFAADLNRVVFRPSWEVPVSIMRKEIRPAALWNPRTLVRQDMELLQGDSVVEPTRANIRRIGYDIRVRQRPGPANPLGGVKFVLANRYQVYLHDSPSRSLFGAARRDFSHGCIRVADAAALARFVLAGQPEWTPDSIAAAMNGSETIEAAPLEPIRVMVVYGTAVVREDGEIRFYSDLYGLDAVLDQALRQGFPYPGFTAGTMRP